MKRAKLISGLSTLLLVSSFPAMGLAKTPESVTPKLGGIPTICHQQRLQKISNLDERYQKYYRLFESYQSAKQDRLVLQLVKDMDKISTQLQASALMQLAYNHLKAKEPEQAIPLVSQAFQLLQLKDDSSKSPISNFPFLDKYQLLKAIGGVSITLKQPEQAEKAFLQGLESIRQEPNLSSQYKIDYMVIIAEGLAELGKRDQGIALLDESLEIGRSLRNRGDWSYLNILGKLSWQYRMIGQTNKADLLFEQSLQYATSFSKPVTKVLALSFIAETIYISLPEYTLNKLAIAQKDSLLKVRQAKLEQLFSRILVIVQANRNVEMAQMIQFAVMAEWWQFLGIEPAMQIANTIADPVERFKALTPILKSIRSSNNDLDLAIPLLNKAEAIITSIQTIADRDAAWNVIATTHAKLNQLPMAQKAIAQIQGNALKQQTLIEVADEFAKANQPEQALKLVQGLPNDAVEQVRYDALRAYLKDDQLEPALSLQSSLSNKYRIYALTELAEVSAKKGHNDQALNFLKQVTEPRWKLQAFVSIVKKAMALGNFEQAVLFAQQISESTDSDIPSKSVMLEEIAIGYAESGQYDKALQIAQPLNNLALSELLSCAQMRSQGTGQIIRDRTVNP